MRVFSICLIVAVAVLITVVAIYQNATREQTNSPGLDGTSAANKQEGMSLLASSLSNLAAIDVADESSAESAYHQIVDIYDLLQTYGLTLTPEQEAIINQIISAYYPAEEIAGMNPLPAGGGALSSGSYALHSDLLLQEQDLIIPEGADVTIELNGYTLTGTGNSSVITVERGGVLTLRDSSFYPSFRTGTITGGTGSQPSEPPKGLDDTEFTVGGGIYVQGDLQMSGGNILNCTATAGGGVYVYSGNFVLSRGTIENCRVEGTSNVYGGGVQISGGGSFQMDGGSIINCSVSNTPDPNIVSRGGGGVSAYLGNFTMNDGLISGCSSDFNGGGIYVSDQGASVTISGGTIENCQAAVNGGGLYLLNSSNVTMTGGTIRSCRATSGGAVCIQGSYGKLNLMDGTLVGCGNTEDESPSYDAENGGGVYIVGGTLQMSGGSISDFAVSSNGGGIYLGLNSDLIITGGQLSRCAAVSNGGGIYANGTQASISGCTISDCKASVNGGGVYLLNGTFILGNDGVIERCQANGTTMHLEETNETAVWDGGGGIFMVHGTTLQLEGGRITSCKSATFGGGVFCYGNFNFSSGVINECSAMGGGGVLIAGAGTFTMNGGSIVDCCATSGNGGGINCSEGTVEIEGNPVITGNTKVTGNGAVQNNLYLPIGRQILLTGTLTDGAAIGVVTTPFAGGSLQLSANENRSSYYADAVQYFTADTDSLIVKADHAEHCLKFGYPAE